MLGCIKKSLLNFALWYSISIASLYYPGILLLIVIGIGDQELGVRQDLYNPFTSNAGNRKHRMAVLPIV